MENQLLLIYYKLEVCVMITEWIWIYVMYSKTWLNQVFSLCTANPVIDTAFIFLFCKFFLLFKNLLLHGHLFITLPFILSCSSPRFILFIHVLRVDTNFSENLLLYSLYNKKRLSTDIFYTYTVHIQYRTIYIYISHTPKLANLSKYGYLQLLLNIILYAHLAITTCN